VYLIFFKSFIYIYIYYFDPTVYKIQVNAQMGQHWNKMGVSNNTESHCRSFPENNSQKFSYNKSFPCRMANCIH
jgi:hypothetical protein